MEQKITYSDIDAFFKGSDPMEHIVKMECGYNDDEVVIIYKDNDGKKRAMRDKFFPFCWASREAESLMFGGDENTLRLELSKAGIVRKRLRTKRDDGTSHERLENGFRILFSAVKPMSFNTFMKLFEKAGVPLFDDKEENQDERKDYYMKVSPVEQYMIYSGKRMFKGYEDYDELLRMEWDLETGGLDPNIHMVDQIGIRTNRGFQKLISVEGDTEEEKFENELKAIREMFSLVREILPDVFTGHNIESFDTYFLDVRLAKHGLSLKKLTAEYFKHPLYKKKRQAVLKLGGEVEYYYPTIFWGVNVTDSLHAVRRAQAQDSAMKKSNLKYVTAYSKLKKPNRVYVNGKIISKTWNDNTPSYAFNDDDGDWYKITEKKPLSDGYTVVTGKYIVERYLMDDLYEGDKVELMYNQSNFLVGKVIPIPFERACTMGTAGIWKSIMLAWSYEHGLGIPKPEPSRAFSGGLSRLLRVGFVENVAKYDYNSLYPSIALTFGIHMKTDIMDVMPIMLEYILTEREKYKGLKKKYGKESEKFKNLKVERIKSLKTTPEYSGMDDKTFGKLVMRDEEVKALYANEYENGGLSQKYDRLQLPYKIFGNSWFGSISSAIFPWNELDGGEEITCIGRQMFRLLIVHFEKRLGYKTIVGDSVTGDTPLFVKYDKDSLIDIKPISEIFNPKVSATDPLGREYDMSEKPYKVLCASGWMKPSYVYRHKARKHLCRVSDGKSIVDCTEDHSVFSSDGEKTKPSGLLNKEGLLYYEWTTQRKTKKSAKKNIDAFDTGVECGKSPNLSRVPLEVLNGTKTEMIDFVSGFLTEFDGVVSTENINKTLLAGLQYLQREISFEKVF